MLENNAGFYFLDKMSAHRCAARQLEKRSENDLRYRTGLLSKWFICISLLRQFVMRLNHDL
jgi:hypothetical protein